LQDRAVNAPDGAVLCLATGNYGRLSITGKKRAGYLTIRPATAATVSMKPFYFNNTSYFRITGISIPAIASDDTTQLWKSNHMELSNLDFSGRGLLMRGVKDSLIANNTIRNIIDGTSAPEGYGIWVNSYITPTDPENGLTGLVIRGNSFYDIPEDGIQMGGGQFYGTKNVLIEANSFDTIGATSSTAHSDAIQIIGGDRITVRANTFRHVQNACMFKDDTLSNSVVENNLMIGDTDARSGVGILCQIWDAPNLTIRNNTIMQYGTYPGMMLRNSGSAIIENNLMNKYTVESGVSATMRNNLIVGANYAFTGDFELPAGSAAIDAANDNAPATDRLGRARVDAAGSTNAGSRAADIGAHERQ
jgi:acetyltransferase-like isoleucine patch superfamily enzyme